MNKIRVIDLFNKIANGEEVPYKVKYNGIIFTYNSSNKQGLKYVDLNEENEVFYRYLTGVVNKLTDEVEIIEEQEEIDIQGIRELDKHKETNIWAKMNDCEDKISELVQAVKQLDRKQKQLTIKLENTVK